MKLRVFLLSLVATAQLGVPGFMIYQQEAALEHGRVFKFHTAPVDPYDAFRGRYVALSFQDDTVTTKDKFPPDTQVWATLEEDEKGFARIQSISREKTAGDNVMPVEVQWGDATTTTVKFPFDRYYMNETAAPAAEAAYRASNRNGQQNSYVTVRVLHGVAALEKLYVNDKPVGP
ncbi:MAG: GDYXXLXY domain-containing protein [Chthoniobacterales bacterium]